MKRIKLSKGKFALIDNVDYPLVSKFKWTAAYQRGRWYAQTNLSMHKLVMLGKAAAIIDHSNNDGLDNQRKNLRSATRSQNTANSKPRSDSKSGLKGVGQIRNKWRAYISMDRKRYHLGMFSTKEEASTMYGLAAIELFGEFARLN